MVTKFVPVPLVFATNVFGLIRVTQAFTPLMLRSPFPSSSSSAKSPPHRGTIVNIGSIVGIRAMPWGGIYGASKHAVHGLSDALRLEVQGLGIKVVTIAPGAIATHFSENMNKSEDDRGIPTFSSPTTESKFYPNIADIRKYRAQTIDLSKGTDPDEFAKGVVDAVTKADPPLLYLAGASSFIFNIIPFFPKWFVDIQLFRRFGCHLVRYFGGRSS